MTIAMAAPAITATASMLDEALTGSNSATTSSATRPPAAPKTAISAAVRARDLGHLCPSVRNPLHRGQVDTRIGAQDTTAGAAHC